MSKREFLSRAGERIRMMAPSVPKSRGGGAGMKYGRLTEAPEGRGGLSDGPWAHRQHAGQLRTELGYRERGGIGGWDGGAAPSEGPEAHAFTLPQRQRGHRATGRLEPAFEIHDSQHGLEGRGKERFLLAPAHLRFAAAQAQVGTELYVAGPAAENV